MILDQFLRQKKIVVPKWYFEFFIFLKENSLWILHISQRKCTEFFVFLKEYALWIFWISQRKYTEFFVFLKEYALWILWISQEKFTLNSSSFSRKMHFHFFGSFKVDLWILCILKENTLWITIYNAKILQMVIKKLKIYKHDP